MDYITRTITRALLAIGLVLALSSCTTEEWIALRFSERGASQAQIDQAVRVARCESGLNPGAVSASGTYLGLFQMSREYHMHRPGMDQWWTAQGNAAAAASLWAEAGWAPWSCSP